MRKIHVCASREYDIFIGNGILRQAGTYIKNVTQANTLAIICGSNVYSLWAEKLIESLNEAGFRVLCHVIPAGEQYKTLETFCDILNFFAENKMTRSDCAVALGGGVTGDLTGFAASAYMRGIQFVQIPTTLLAMVDSSVGGKTAVDLPSGKNLAGAFYQPSLVLCDTDTLKTLPECEFRSGCAEVIKYAVLLDGDFFNRLLDKPISEQMESVIAECVSMKRNIVDKDEYDHGCRTLLNLGHTFGHAIELCSNYKLSHGYAVAIGMNLITKAAVKRGLCSEAVQSRVEEILKFYQLPTETDITLNELAQAIMKDKKMAGSMLSLVVPREIGRCEIIKINSAEITQWLEDAAIL